MTTSLFKSKLFLEVPADLMKVMHYCEDSCVMGCCGIACLSLEVAEKALVQLNDMQELVRGHRGPVTSGDSGFGQDWDHSEEALLFLQQVHTSLSAAIDHVKLHTQS